jgi:hypothetical protein
MFLHIIGDEKFIDFAIEQFESVAQQQNQFVLLYEDELSEVKFIKHSDKVEQCRVGSKRYDEILSLTNSYKAIFIHYLDDLKIRFINDCPTPVDIVWMFWGQDAQKVYVDRAYLPLTSRIVREIFGWNEYLWPYTNWIRRLYLSRTTRGKAMKRVKYCAPIIKEEFHEMTNKLSLSYRHLEFNYGSIESNFKDVENNGLTGDDILVGNSSTITSNHSDVFMFLKRIGVKGRKIVVPLSYGNRRYRDLIVKMGMEMFGDSFVPIVNFLPLAKYNSILGSCGHVVMNHLRQQGLGNIQISLWRGSKVYMNESSILYRSLINKGYVIFKIQDLEAHLGKDESLIEEIRECNRQLLIRDYGKKTTLNRTKAIVDHFSNGAVH